jgi:mannose/cellobiose epimerase-like protein (N-acyl-D-glucosamine 2-epimerase family)
LSPDGNVASSTRDTYAHAFVLLGLASYHRLIPDRQILDIANKTIQFMDESLASERGGFYDCVPRTGNLRRQNPHMHLFEAFIALYESSGDSKYLERAKNIFELFKASFFREDRGYLCEYFTDELMPLSGNRGQIFEPGHHYEWLWLLRKFEALAGENAAYYCRRLYERADRYGWDEKGFIIDEVNSSGLIAKKSRRTWPHTEALKANLLEASSGRNGADARAAQCINTLMQHYLGRPVPGGWIDHLDERGKPLVDFMPASTLYHIVCAAAETDRVVNPG